MLARLTRRPNRTVRRGGTIVESVLVLSVFLLLLFGMFEYCRFLLVLHVTNNAARDGARYAAVNVDKPDNFPNVNYTDNAGKVYPSIKEFTRRRMGGAEKQVVGFRVAVYAVDQTGLDLNPPVVRPKTKSTAIPAAYPNMFATNDPLAVPWNNVPFPERLAVTIDGTYKPLLPTFLLMPATIKINVTSLTSGEG
jgi:hypothetical protein